MTDAKVFRGELKIRPQFVLEQLKIVQMEDTANGAGEGALLEFEHLCRFLIFQNKLLDNSQ
jgi:hypothetical protein